MRVLIVMQHINFFRNLDTLVRELDARGHEIVVLHGTPVDDPKTEAKLAKKREKMVFMGRGIEVAQSDIPDVKVGYRPEPEERWQKRLRVGRQVVSLGIYLRKGHPSPERVFGGLEKRLPSGVRKLVGKRIVRAVLGRRITLRVWRWIERLSPASRTVLAILDDLRPDVVVVSPTVWPKNPVEADYIRAARARRIPVVGYLNSWDNLTSKGTVHAVPDAYIVWNEALAQEAAILHDIPERVMHVTGAPHLDRFFEMKPTQSREEVCREMGCPPEAPYVVYLCSSRTLITSEVGIVTRLAEALVDEFPEGPPTIVVRPHPVNPQAWEGFAHPGVVVYPTLGDQADSPESWQAYYNQLAGATCFIGLNTTAFLEAAVTDRPVLTIVADEFYETQGYTGHFRHLLAADFMEVAADMPEIATRVRRALDGVDEKSVQRRAFVESFLRPRGLDLRATPEVADVLDLVVTGVRTKRPRSGEVGSRAVRDLVTAEEDR